MKVIADENIPGLDCLPGDWLLQRRPGRAIDAALCRDADVLLVRSVTIVDASLLDGSEVQFVGSATAGCDHIDVDYLARSSRRFVYAPGCNANAVVDYVMSAMLAAFSDEALLQQRMGIVGFGQVGSRLFAACDRLGLDIQVYDPLVETGDTRQVERFEQLQGCSILSLHVPLSRQGEHATLKMITAARLQQFQQLGLLINASRGGVVDGSGLGDYLHNQGRHLRCVLDVWEGEPHIDASLHQHCWLVTPHIAGYSTAGKRRGTSLVLRQLLGDDALPGEWQTRVHRPADSWALDAASASQRVAAYRQQLSTLYSACDDAHRFAGTLSSADAVQHASLFDDFRKGYALRDEIDYTALL